MREEQLSLRLLATTDLHGNYYHYDYYKDQSIPRFGLISLAKLIEEAREEISNNLLFDNGDLIQGAPLGDYMRDYALEKTHPAFLLMNEIGYDAATLGNHEFNFGLPFLEEILPQANFPYLCANLVEEKSGKPWLPPYQLLERQFISDQGNVHTLTIGIIGVLPPQVLRWDKTHFDQYRPHLVTLDITETVAHYLPILRAEGADLIVVLAHTGYSTDPYELGAENSAYYLTQLTGVDAVIAGHQHRRFPSADFADKLAVGFDCERGLINGVPSVMPGSWSRYLGVIDFRLVRQKEGWKIVERSAHLRETERYLSEDYLVDPHYEATLKAAHQLARKKMNVAIGPSDLDFYSYLSLIQDDSCLQIVADAQIDYAKRSLADALSPYAELPMIAAVPLFKVGSRKDDPTYFTEIPAGEITFKDIADLYVYPNQLVVLKLSGANLKEWLECCVSIYHTIDPTDSTPQSLINWAQYRSYNVDIIKGVEYTIDLRQPPRYNGDLEKIDEAAERICSLTFEGRRIVDEDQFLMVTNSYRALVDRFPGSGRENAVAITTREIPDLLLEHIEHIVDKRGQFSLTVDHNWAIDFSKLVGTKLIFESANTPSAPAYIAKESQQPMALIGYDPEGFALYQIEP